MLVQTGEANVHKTAEMEKGILFGKNVTVWRWSHVSEGTVLGDNVMIGEGVFIGKNSKIGSDVRIQNGTQIFEGVIIEDRVYIGPNVVFTNVRKPKVDRKAEKYLETIIKKGASIGANSTVICGVEVGEGATILPGTVVHKSIPPKVTACGNPARIAKQPKYTL